MTDVSAASDDTGNVIRAALRLYKTETEHYLASYRSWPLTSPYDPECCPTCRSEHNRWQDREFTRRALQDRLDTINLALTEHADA